MYGLKLKTVKTQGCEQSQVFGTVTLLQQDPGQQQYSLLKPPLPGGHDDLDLKATLTPDLDLNMGVEGFGLDSLGDASLDCFGDLSCMMENNFLYQPQPDVPKEEEQQQQQQSEPHTYLSLQPAFLKPQLSGGEGILQLSEDPFNTAFLGVPEEEEVQVEDEEEQAPSDLAQLASNVGLKRPRTPSLDDHDYSTKRSRSRSRLRSHLDSSMSSVDDPFIVPEAASSPAPSTSSDITPAAPPHSKEEEDEKRKNRRVKNNLASKRSREIRKQKFVNMDQEAEKLTAENARLVKRVADMQNLAQRMKDILVSKLKIQT